MSNHNEPLSDAELDRAKSGAAKYNNITLLRLIAELTRLRAEVEELRNDLVFCDGTEAGPNSAKCDSCGWAGDPDFTNGEYHCPECGVGGGGFVWDSYRDAAMAENERLRTDADAGRRLPLTEDGVRVVPGMKVYLLDCLGDIDERMTDEHSYLLSYKGGLFMPYGSRSFSTLEALHAAEPVVKEPASS